jgi:hypothetical protein
MDSSTAPFPPSGVRPIDLRARVALPLPGTAAADPAAAPFARAPPLRGNWRRRMQRAVEGVSLPPAAAVEGRAEVGSSVSSCVCMCVYACVCEYV